MLQAALPDLPTWLSCFGSGRKKNNTSNRTGSFGNSRTFFLCWNDCWPPTFYNFLLLVCKMRAGRRGRGWALGCSGRSCLRKLPGTASQKQRAWGRKTHQAGYEKTFFSPELLFSLILPKPQLSVKAESCIGTQHWADAKCSSSRKTRLPPSCALSQPPPAYQDCCGSCKQRGIGRSEVVPAETKWQTCNEPGQVAGRWGGWCLFQDGWKMAGWDFSKSNTNSQNHLAGFGCWCLLDPLRNKLMS